MHKIKWILILILLIMVEVSLAERLRIKAAKPDLILCGVLFFGLYGGGNAGFKTGLLAGFLKGIFGGAALGANLVIYALLGSVAGSLSQKVYKQAPQTQFVLALGGSLVSLLCYYTFMSLSRSAPLFREALIYVILPSSIYTALAAPVVFLVMSKFYKKLSWKREIVILRT